ncbi:helix-turn-helix domain-containing protein [Flavobacterium sp. M31R6]|uniref:helix-turn-helix domain-containing protein n=1 Tax=Flavobacterium sp. M31R6 TaxID=2739062 RepID=UPI00156A6F5E|nr:helix-turn-helix domain-containing protein [Flavobacterium sp. M31R6]QKJ63352.1 helix-turn-helix domain-containing protein [Flavobacterium sp. M31R6]
MQNNAILVENLSIEKLAQLIDKSVKEGIQQFNEEFRKKENSEELLTREETCQFFKIDSSTLWAWTNSGKVKAHGIGSRRYYKRSELLECLTLLKK